MSSQSPTTANMISQNLPEHTSSIDNLDATDKMWREMLLSIMPEAQMQDQDAITTFISLCGDILHGIVRSPHKQRLWTFAHKQLQEVKDQVAPTNCTNVSLPPLRRREATDASAVGLPNIRRTAQQPLLFHSGTVVCVLPNERSRFWLARIKQPIL